MDFTLFQELTQLYGVSGYEKEVSRYISEKMAPYADDITLDTNGNLIVFKKGQAANAKKLLFAAHMDEIGLQVIKVEDDGRLMVKQLGSCWIYTTYQSRVIFRNGTIGIVASRVPPEQLEGKHVNLYIDIGVHSKEEAMKYVDIGDACSYAGPYAQLPGDYVTSKAIDDRVGCFMQMQALMDVKTPQNDVYMAFTVQEEVGTRGGGVVAHRVRPDIGVAVDVTPAHDRPGDLEGSNAMGKGVAIKISDTASISDEYLLDLSYNLCKENDIPFQKDVIYVGGTDAAPIYRTRDGIKTIGFSVVTRYTHGPNALANTKDIEATVALMNAFMNVNFKF